jgi:hypothetical protein
MSINNGSDKSVSKGQYVLYASLLCLAGLTFVIVKSRGSEDLSEVAPKTFRIPKLTPPYQWSGQDSTAVIAMRDGYHFCEESMSFYTHLISMERQKEIRTRIIFVLPDTDSIGKSDVPPNASDSQVFYNVPLRSFGVTGTPSILLVDKSGKVARVWQGRLTPDQENRVIFSFKWKPGESFSDDSGVKLVRPRPGKRWRSWAHGVMRGEKAAAVILASRKEDDHLAKVLQAVARLNGRIPHGSSECADPD